MTKTLSLFKEESTNSSKSRVVNVASVPQRSPFRYPGGKTWLIPTIRDWLNQEQSSGNLIEPFAGGGIVSLTAAFERLATSINMCELDEEVAAVWKIVFSDQNGELADRILNFELTHENVNFELNKLNKTTIDLAFCTILKNRVFHGGIIAKGSGMLKKGENGKGISSRWYPKTLSDRIRAIHTIKESIKFTQGDGFELLKTNISERNLFVFIDPPYTIAGKRLYTHFQIDHDMLFNLASQLQGKFMLTYDDTEEIRALAEKYKLEFRTIPMKTTHHHEKNEIVISDNFSWWKI
jgi:DNA adenine methylase